MSTLRWMYPAEEMRDRYENDFSHLVECEACGFLVDTTREGHDDEDATFERQLGGHKLFWHHRCALEYRRKEFAKALITLHVASEELLKLDEEALLSNHDYKTNHAGAVQLTEAMHELGQWMQRNGEQLRKVAQTGEEF
jgi:hypothetical protein